MEHKINNVFPTPVYIVKRDTDLSPKEKKDIDKIVKEGMYENAGNSTSNNSYIFNGKLKKCCTQCSHYEPYTNLTKKNFINKNLKKIYDKFFNKKVEIQRLKNKTRIESDIDESPLF